MGKVGSIVTPFSLHSSSCILTLVHLANLITSWNLWTECFQPPLDYQVSYVFHAPTLFPLVLPMFLVEHITGKFR